MSQQLQVLLDDQELAEIEAAARRLKLPLSEWVRQALGLARRPEPQAPGSKKLAAIREAVRHEFPTADIQHMLAEIESGYQGPTG
jgi:hypothetical protein